MAKSGSLPPSCYQVDLPIQEVILHRQLDEEILVGVKMLTPTREKMSMIPMRVSSILKMTVITMFQQILPN